MKYQCLNCSKLFIYPAKILEPIDKQERNIAIQAGGLSFISNVIETHVCPYCQSLDIEEYSPPIETPVQEQTESVYIYELTTGAQKDLDALLAQGYNIVNRYSKQYHLEKPKLEVKQA